MKKILLVFMILLFLVGCGKKGCNNETVEFDHSGILTYYLDENPTDKLKELKLKVTNKGKETVYLLNDESIKISGFNFDKIGEYKALVTFNNNTYSFKYKVVHIITLAKQVTPGIVFPDQLEEFCKQ